MCISRPTLQLPRPSLLHTAWTVKFVDKKVIFQGCRYKRISSCNTYMEVCAEILTCAGFHAFDPQIIGPTLQQCATQMPFSSWYNIWCCQPSSVVPSQKGRLKIPGRNVDHFIDRKRVEKNSIDKKRVDFTKCKTNLIIQVVCTQVMRDKGRLANKLSLDDKSIKTKLCAVTKCRYICTQNFLRKQTLPPCTTKRQRW